MAVDALEFAAGTLRVAFRVFMFACEFFMDVFVQLTGRLLYKVYDRKNEPSEDVAIVIGLFFWVGLALCAGLYYMAT